MNFKTFLYFLTVAEELNITRAANKLYISQQSLSEHIAKLEREYNIQLFIRGHRQLSLTYAGEFLVNIAKQIIALQEEIENKFDDINHNHHGRLTFGISFTRARYFIPEILPKFKQLFPNIEFSLIHGDSEHLEKQLLNGKADIIMGINRFTSSEIDFIHLLDEKLYIIVSEKTMREIFPKIYKDKIKEMENGVNITSFAHCGFLLLSPKNRIRQILDTLFINNNIKPNILVETDDIEMPILLASENKGIAFYPEFLLRAKGMTFLDIDSRNRLHAFPLKDRLSNCQFVIGYHRNHNLTYATKTFINMLIDRYNSIIRRSES